MADYLANGNDLTAIANAIRAKGGTSASLEFPSDFIDAVGDIVAVSEVPQRSSSDLSASGATVTAPSGYYPSSVSKAVSSGSVTYPDAISSSGATGSHSGTNVVVSKTVTVTPSVTAGYITSVSGSNVSITMQASDNNFVAGNIKKDVSIFGLTGTYEGSGGGGKNVQGYMGQDYSHTNSLVATDVSLKVAKSGTYKVSWSGFRNTTSGTNQSQLYINGTAYGSAQGTFTSSYGQNVVLSGVSLNKNDVITVYARARSTSYYMYVSNLIIEEQ